MNNVQKASTLKEIYFEKWSRKMQKSGCLLCKSENPIYKNSPSEKKLLLRQWPFANKNLLNKYHINEATLNGDIRP